MKARKESWLLSQDNIARIFFYLLIILLPTQLGRHFWPNFSYVFGLRLDYLSPIIYLTDLIILIILFFSFKNILKFIKSINKKNKILILIILSFLIIGIIFSKSPIAGLYGIVKLTEFFFLSIYVLNNFQKLNKEKLFIAFSIPIIYESLLSFFQIINKGSLGGSMYLLGERAFNQTTPGVANASINGELILRPYATFSHPNVFAGFLIIYMLFLLHSFSKNNKYVLISLLIIGTLSLFLTLSRIAIIYWIFCLIFLFGISIFKKYKNAKTKVVKYILIFVPIFFISYLFLNQTILVQRFLETRIFDQSIVQRQELINSSILMFIDHPIFGVGLNNFYFNLTTPLLVQPVHNIFLMVLSQGGIVVSLIFIYMLIRAINKNNIYLLLSLLAIIFIGSFDHYFLTLQQGQIITALVLGATFSYKIKQEVIGKNK